MSLSDIQTYLEQFINTRKTVTELSKDTNNQRFDSHNWCVSDAQAFCLDDIVKCYCTNYGFENFSSVDAISIHENDINLIEFKNSSWCKENTKRSLKIKISDTIRFIEKIVLNSKFIDNNSVYIRYILVFNPITKNEGLRKTTDELFRLAKKGPSDKERLSNIRNYVQALQLCNEFLILYPDEFINNINNYLE